MRRSTQNLPSGSPPMQEVKPTRLPKREILWAKIAEELPRVIAKSLARCSLSGSSTEGRPYRIKSQLSSPTTPMSKRATPWSPFTTAPPGRFAEYAKHPLAQCGRVARRGNLPLHKRPRAPVFARREGPLRQRKRARRELRRRSQRWTWCEVDWSKRERPLGRPSERRQDRDRQG